MANTWGESGTTWGQGNCGEQNNFTVSGLTGLAATGSLGTPLPYSEQGWGRAGWGEEPWGDSYDPVIAVTGYSITASLGTLAYSQSIEGWGRDEWGYGNWGQNITTVADLTGFEMTGLIGGAGWGRSTWGNDAWGEESIVNIELGEPLTGQSMTGSLGTPTPNYDFIFTLSESLLGTLSRGSISINDGADHTQGLGTQLITGTLNSSGISHTMTYAVTGYSSTMSVGTVEITSTELINLTGLSITGSLGTPTPNYDFIFTLSDSLLGTLSRGVISINDGADHTQGLGTQLITGTLNSSGMSHSMTYAVTGYSSTMSMGTLTFTETELIPLTGLSITGSLGTLGTIDDMRIGLSGQAITGSLGSLASIDPMQIGLTGYSITASLASSNVSPLGYQDISMTGNTSYSNVDITGNTSYTDVDVA